MEQQPAKEPRDQLFKYYSYTSRIVDCPPSSFQPDERLAYRFTFENIDSINTFLPVSMINPQRFTPGGCPDSVLCASFGLSLYDTIENARRKLKNLAKSIAKRGYNTIGTHIAEGVIDRDDGVLSPIGSDGHFTLHESINADLAAKFVVVYRVI